MDIKDKLQRTIEQGVSASKKYLAIAKDKARDFSEMSVKKLEVHQLEEEIKKKKFLLGEIVCDLFLRENKQSITQKTAGVKELLERLDSAVNELVLRKGDLENENNEKPGN